ncbi:hypothetical protein TNIN_29681 [Trichonephila inaurata madagascariensis]|uniref:Uncharacterized protein n=1 Tax=Trichonephila inaurata madagascariensis TaxID=2747483 RepID=A0A8X6YXU9_9ARAC|nr:hypothetical protein TNIN_29681 [Trichonephila inaurata madagascariensis]
MSSDGEGLNECMTFTFKVFKELENFLGEGKYSPKSEGGDKNAKKCLTVVANPGSLAEIRAAARKRKGAPDTLMEAPFSRLLRRRQEVFVADIRAFDLPRAGDVGSISRLSEPFLRTAVTGNVFSPN